MFEFIQLVEDIAEGYFDGGVYQPHIGELNAMRIWYNSNHPDDEDVVDATEFAEIIKDEKVVSDYFAAISERSDKLDFVQAYDMAMDMVVTKKGSAITLLEGVISRLNTVLSQENIDKVTALADGIKSGETVQQLADKVAEDLKSGDK